MWIRLAAPFPPHLLCLLLPPRPWQRTSPRPWVPSFWASAWPECKPSSCASFVTKLSLAQINWPCMCPSADVLQAVSKGQSTYKTHGESPSYWVILWSSLIPRRLLLFGLWFPRRGPQTLYNNTVQTGCSTCCTRL